MPKRLSAKIRTTALIPTTKYGFVNWNAQLISRPADLKPINSRASPMNQAKMPATKASPLRRIRRRSCPACWMNPKILSAITGNTHGIRLRMKPPMKPKRRYFQKDSGIEVAVATTAGGVDDQGGGAPPFFALWQKKRPTTSGRSLFADCNGEMKTGFSALAAR